MRAPAAVVRAERRFRARRRARRRRAVRPAVVAAAVVTVVVGVGWTLLGSSVLAVRRVSVEGTSRLSSAEVLATADVPLGRSLLRIDPGAIRRRVATLPQVAAVTVSRSWPHGLVIRVTERRPAAAALTGNGAVLLDATGVAFATVPSPPSGLVTVRLGAPVPGPGAADARAAMQVLAVLPPRLRDRVETVAAPTPESVSLQLRGDRTVVWGSPDEAATKVAVLRVLLRHKASRYDVSTPGVAVVG